MRLGKLEPREDNRTLTLATYIHADLPSAPVTLDYSDKVLNWGMYLNDRLGDCLAAGTKVLTSDLLWVDIAEVKIGDKLVGFDEEPGVQSRQYREAIVERSEILIKPCYDLVFEDGTKIRASEDHMWLRKKRPKGSWIATKDLRVRGKRSSQIAKCFDVWDAADTKGAGYLAGAFDGEGCYSVAATGTMKTMQFSQRDNAMLDAVEEQLHSNNFAYTRRHVSSSSLSNKGYEVIRLLGGRKQITKFLGVIRPARLLAKFNVQQMAGMEVDRVKLVSKVFVGNQPVVAVQTSTHTFIAEGLASHNCTCAAAAHMIELWDALADESSTVTDSEVVTLYNLVNNGVDGGAVELDVLKTWRNQGLGGHKISAFVKLDPGNREHIKLGLALFGGVYIGVQLPQSAMDSIGQVWEVSRVINDDIIGGHALNVVAYDADTLTFVTWGKVQKATWEWWTAYVDEAWVALTSDWAKLPANKIISAGLDYEQLSVDLGEL